MFRVTVQDRKDVPSFVKYQGEDKDIAAEHYTEYTQRTMSYEVCAFIWRPGNGTTKRGWACIAMQKRYLPWNGVPYEKGA